MEKEVISDHVERIIASKGFGRSRAYARLLRYIVGESEQGRVPKETSIAIDVFGKDATYNPSEDTLVRVYMHNLRKKLAHYYAHAGKEESFRITIPKGKYEAVIVPASSQESLPIQPDKNPGWRKWGMPLLATALVLSVLGHGMSWWKSREVTTGVLGPFWDHFFSGKQPLTLILGDIFVFEEYDEVLGRSRVVRDAQVNSPEELAKLVEQSPEFRRRQPVQSENPLLTKSQVNSLQQLFPLLAKTGKEYALRIMSRVTPEEIQERDVIFVGLYKTLGLLEYVWVGSPFSITPPYTTLQHLPSGKSFSQVDDPLGPHTDYAWIAHLEGPGGNRMLIISSFTDTGILEGINQLTDPVLAKALTDQISEALGGTDGNWELLLEVEGFDRTNLGARVMYVIER